MSGQSNLFGAPQEQPKAKALPKREPAQRPAPTSHLSPADLALRDKNLGALKAYRVRCKVSDIRVAEGACESCGGERVAELAWITERGTQVWEARCLTCQGAKP